MNALILSAVFGVVMLFSGLAIKSYRPIQLLAIAGVAVLFVVNAMEMRGVHFFNISTSGMIQFDRFGLLFINIALGLTLIFFFISGKDMQEIGRHYAEYFALIFFIICGIILVATYSSLLILFLGIEIISIPLYILTGSDKKNLNSNEASLKYLLMGAFSTGLMLMGITLIYGATGSFELAKMNFAGDQKVVLPIAGMLLLFFSMSFKVSVVPFHFWAPDVYDGAPAPITSFMATIIKAAAFIGFIRLFDQGFGDLQGQWKIWVAVITAATLFVGNITAVFQQSVKRMLAYSSISQAGFMLFALLAMNSDAKEGILLYAAAYSLATIGIFAVLARMKDYSFEGFNGLAKQQPLVAAVLAIALLSLSGVPLTAGFLSKFYMLKAVMGTGSFLWLVIFAVLMAAVSIYYYFRLIQAMYFKDGSAAIPAEGSFKTGLVIIACLIILLGLFPGIILNWYYF